MNRIEEQYRGLLGSLLHNSNKKQDRTGTGTHSIFGGQIRHQMSDGFPLLTTKKMAFKTMVTELLWFLRGDTNIKYLVEISLNQPLLNLLQIQWKNSSTKSKPMMSLLRNGVS